jgi:hypothetical protein
MDLRSSSEIEAAVWLMACMLVAACGGASEEPPEPGDPAGSSGAADGQPAEQALTGIVCGVENTERIAAVVCAYHRRQCEVLAGCCNAAGFAGSAAQCTARAVAQCQSDVRAFLEAGSCFDTALYDPSCDDAIIDYQRSCELPPLLSAEFRENYEARCPTRWTRGDLAEGEACVWYSNQCAVPDASSVSYCFPDFARDGDLPVCRVFVARAEGEPCGDSTDSCIGGTRCSSAGTCQFSAPLGAACTDGFADCDSGLCENGVCIDGAGRPCEQGCGRLHTCGPDNLCAPPPLATSDRCDFSPLATTPTP